MEMRGWLLAVVFAALIFSGCVAEGETAGVEENGNVSTQENVQAEIAPHPCAQKTSMQTAFCLSDLAIRMENIEVCGQIYEMENDTHQAQISRDYCIAKFASHKNDSEFCLDIKTDSIKDACLMDLAVRNGPHECAEIKSERNRNINCYTKIAKAKNDSGICSQIGESDYKSLCMALVLQSQSECAQINDSQLSDFCYLQIAWDSGDWSSCLGIREEMEHDVCLAIIASRNLDEKICKNVKIDENMQNCMQEVEKARQE